MDNLAQAILLSGSKYIPVDLRKKIEGILPWWDGLRIKKWNHKTFKNDSLPKEGLPQTFEKFVLVKAFLQEL